MQRELVVLLAVIAVALAGIGIAPHAPKPDKYKDSEGCWVPEIEHFIPLGQTFSSVDPCQQYECTATDMKFTICSPVVARPPCPKVDRSKPFPACCDVRCIP